METFFVSLFTNLSLSAKGQRIVSSDYFLNVMLINSGFINCLANVENGLAIVSGDKQLLNNCAAISTNWQHLQHNTIENGFMEASVGLSL